MIPVQEVPEVRNHKIQMSIVIKVGCSQAFRLSSRRERPWRLEPAIVRAKQNLHRLTDLVYSGIDQCQIRQPVSIEVSRDDLVGKVCRDRKASPNIQKLAISSSQHNGNCVGVEIGRDVVGLAIVIEVTRGERRRSASGGHTSYRAEIAA